MSGSLSRPPFSDGGRESSANSEDENEPAIVPLAAGREKRATAGNRLSSLLEKEGDDELELLFAENGEEEDIEFEEEEVNASDVELDSSTDEEDQPPAKGENDSSGEKELRREERQERQKKRKARDVLQRPRLPTKKVKIEPSATPITPASRPKKKSERLSHGRTEIDAPLRASSRKQTVQNREVVHQRLAESEQTRLKVMQQMEEAQKRKDAAKPKALTQADRLEEAAKTERRNAKSLNRWEESEKKRAEEQRAKLEALHNRQLTGPVITWWSGLARWVNGKVAQLGVKNIRKAGYVEPPTIKEYTGPKVVAEQLPKISPTPVKDIDNVVPEVLHPHHLTEPSERLALPISHHHVSLPQQITFATPHSPYGFLDGIHAYAAMPMQQQRAEFTGTADGGFHSQPTSSSMPPVYYDSGRLSSLPVKALTPEIEFASRTLVALKEIDANAVKLPEMQSSVLLKRPRAKTTSE